MAKLNTTGGILVQWDDKVLEIPGRILFEKDSAFLTFEVPPSLAGETIEFATAKFAVELTRINQSSNLVSIGGSIDSSFEINLSNRFYDAWLQIGDSVIKRMVLKVG